MELCFGVFLAGDIRVSLNDEGISTRSRMLDFVIAVDSAEQWHLENMNSHGNMCHCSSLMK